MEAKVRLFRDGRMVKETAGTVGETLLEVVTAAGEFLDAPCGGLGKCGKCLVRLSPGGEEVKACQTKLEGDTDIYLPSEMDDMKIADTGEGAKHNVGGFTGPYGIAVDIGTTTVVAHLTDLPTGTRIATASGVNAQMCIRDSPYTCKSAWSRRRPPPRRQRGPPVRRGPSCPWRLAPLLQLP